MQLRTLPGTGVTTTAIGLGCAGLYRLPRRADRAAVLRAALAAGIRHFDTAPMYGLGRAESELAPYLRSKRSELTVTTKFGIGTSAFGRTAARLQTPVRAVLARRPGLQHAAGESGSGPSGGTLGRLLYTSAGYDAGAAARSLRRSLRELGTDYVDVFALHDPMGAAISRSGDLVGYLDDQVRAGTIRTWGVAGDLPPPGSDAQRVLEDAPVVQQHDDVLSALTTVATDRALITYGCLARALPALLRYLAASGTTAQWSDRLGDRLDAETMAALLLREAVRRNAHGVVLFSTTRPERVGAAVDALTAADDPAESAVLRAMVDAAAQHRTDGSA